MHSNIGHSLGRYRPWYTYDMVWYGMYVGIYQGLNKSEYGMVCMCVYTKG